MTEREKMLAGELYKAWDAELAKMRADARVFTEELRKTPIQEEEKRRTLLQQMLGSCGTYPYVENNFRCDYGCHIHVGDNFYANFDCVMLDAAEIKIGNNCMIAPQVGLYTATHPLDVARRVDQLLEYAQPITIGDNCWIGGHATILPGVTLGDNVVVAGGAVVTKSFGNNVVIGGNPARVLKNIKK
ncbi:sugar O-acetyltransferase [Lachnospiraceae bacterium LCP25S3_G4]